MKDNTTTIHTAVLLEILKPTLHLYVQPIYEYF